MDRGGEGAQLSRQVDMRWTEGGGRSPTATSGGREVDIGGKGANSQNSTLDYPFEGSAAVLNSRP